MYTKYYALVAEPGLSVVPLTGAEDFDKACEMADKLPTNAIWILDKNTLYLLKASAIEALGVQ